MCGGECNRRPPSFVVHISTFFFFPVAKNRAQHLLFLVLVMYFKEEKKKKRENPTLSQKPKMGFPRILMSKMRNLSETTTTTTCDGKWGGGGGGTEVPERSNKKIRYVITGYGGFFPVLGARGARGRGGGDAKYLTLDWMKWKYKGK